MVITMNNENTILIDKDIVDSLRGLYFGSFSDLFCSVGVRAYRDFNRTLSFGSYPKEKRELLRATAIDILRSAFDSLNRYSIPDQASFDAWHRKIADNLIQLYAVEGISFAYGQAQKWINMTAKYLYIVGERDFAGLFEYLHIPIDKYILDIAFEKFQLRKPSLAWSKWNYNQYISYQNELRKLIVDEVPLRWEFHNWIVMARDYGRYSRSDCCLISN